MGKAHAVADAVIAAHPATIYAILADYQHGHQQILPQQYFRKVEVEQGGRGAGTVIRIHMRVLGSERVFRQIVSEPEPGRVLVEKDLDSGLITTFTVTPISDNEQAHVTIATEWEPGSGIFGWVEKEMTRCLLGSIYTKELKQLDSYVRRLAASTNSVS